MNKCAEEVYSKFYRHWLDNPGMELRESFVEYVAPFLKEPTQEEVDEREFQIFYKTANKFEGPGEIWHAALKWERERKKNS